MFSSKLHRRRRMSAASGQSAAAPQDALAQALSIQATSGTVGAVEFLRSRGFGQDIVGRVLMDGLSRSQGPTSCTGAAD